MQNIREGRAVNAMAELPIAHQVDWPRIGKAYAAMDDERKAANDGLNAWLRTMRGNCKGLVCPPGAAEDYDAMVKLMEARATPAPSAGTSRVSAMLNSRDIDDLRADSKANSAGLDEAVPGCRPLRFVHHRHGKDRRVPGILLPKRDQQGRAYLPRPGRWAGLRLLQKRQGAGILRPGVFPAGRGRAWGAGRLRMGGRWKSFPDRPHLQWAAAVHQQHDPRRAVPADHAAVQRKGRPQ